MFKKYFGNTNQMKILGRLLGSLLAILLFMFVTLLQMAFAATLSYMDTIPACPTVAR